MINEMDSELYNETLSTLCKDPVYSKYQSIFNKLAPNHSRMVHGKYLYVSPSPLELSADDYDHNYAKCLFSMKYNELFDIKHNINSSDPDSDSDDYILCHIF
jgi:hypothetical protein